VFIILNMRILWRTVSPELLRDVGLVCLADGIVGVSFGATSVGGGLAWWVPVALSVLVFAGGSQIAAVGVVLAGGSPVAAVFAGAVLNTRLFPYGLAVADVVGGTDRAGAAGAGSGAGEGGPDHAGAASTGSGAGEGGPADARGNPLAGRWLRGLRQLVGTHLITDESVAFAMRQRSPARRRSAFWACGVMLFVVWNVAVLLGVALGSTVRDTNAFGLDATFPAVMLALALPTLTSRSTRLAAGTGAVIAVALTPVLPAGLPLLAALGGLSARWDWRNWSRRRSWGGWRSASPPAPRDDRSASSPATYDDHWGSSPATHDDEARNPPAAGEGGAGGPARRDGDAVVDQGELSAGGNR
jgi:predicted branched-subunit amino acid permease